MCPVCFWEDDGQDDHGADIIRGGPNHGLSLTEARDNFWKMGACDESVCEWTRPPFPEAWEKCSALSLVLECAGVQGSWS